MSLLVGRENLLAALNLASKVVATRTTMPVFQMGLMDAGTLHVSSGELALALPVPMEGAVNGPFLLPVNRVIPLLKSLHAPGLTIDVAKSITIEADATKWSLPIMDPEEFPLIAVEQATGFQVEREAFADLFSRVKIAACKDSRRENLNGVYLTTRGDRLAMVACDGARLCAGTIRCEGATPFKAMAAYNHIRIIEAFLEARCSDFDTLEVINNPAQVLVLRTADGAQLICGLVEPNFPDYEQILPGPPMMTLTVNTAALSKAIRQLLPLTNESGGASLAFSDTEILLAVNNEHGDGQVRVPCESNEKGMDPLTIAYNLGFLLDALGAVNTDETIVSVPKPEVPALKIESTDVGDEWLCVIMGMKG